MIFKAGRVIHYYDKLSVAIIELIADLGVGEMVRFSKNGEPLFDQKVRQIQSNQEQIQMAKSGTTVALKVDNKVSENTEIFKI